MQKYFYSNVISKLVSGTHTERLIRPSTKFITHLKLLPLVLFTAILLMLQAKPAFAEGMAIDVVYLAEYREPKPVLSNVLPVPEDLGVQGARLGVADSNSTGKFLNQEYQLIEELDLPTAEITEKFWQHYQQQKRFFVVDLSAANLQALVKYLTEKKLTDAIIINAGSADDSLRFQQCLPILHTLPSRAMLADALAQWLQYKRLTDWFLITGPTEDDKAFSAALKRSAARYGHKVIEEKLWTFDTDIRRLAQSEMPVFTQAAGGDDYDIVLVADEAGDFGEYVLYNTWLPRPVAGTQGLKPVGWHRVVEQWGAAQLQSRFDKLAHRWMFSKDYAAWAGVRSIAEAVTRTNSIDSKTINDYIRSDEFELAGFKGQKLSYRQWNGQLRQPIALVHSRSIVSQSPQEGFLHAGNELDTLGYDAPEMQCQ